jgi:rhodanese-related sulfurtransferase
MRELGQITGSRNIALDELEPRLPELSYYLEKSIALVCATDRRSQKAARILAMQGFADVHVVTGEMAQWNRDGLSVLSHTN